VQERCRLVAVLGMGGIGKTALCVKLAKQIKDKFEVPDLAIATQLHPSKTFMQS